MNLCLCNADIDRISEKISDFLTEYGTESRNILRLRLLTEEVLFSYQKRFGEEAAVTLSQERHLRRDTLVLRIPGESFDPFSVSDERFVMHNLLTNAGIDPVWSYKRGCNCIVITPDRTRKISELAWIALSVVLGIGLGSAAQLLPEPAAAVIADDVLSPLSDTVMSFLSAMSVFLIFFSIITGICGMGDLSTFQRIGKKMIGKLMLTLAFYAVIACAVMLPFTTIGGEGSAAPDGKALYAMLLDIVPDNILAPFLEGNSMQVAFLAVCIGIAMLMLNLKVGGVLDILMQLTELVQRIVVSVIGLLPLVVFVSVFKLVALRQVSALYTVYRYPLFLVLAEALILLIGLLRVSVIHKVSPFRVLKKLLPTIVIAFSTASSIAAYTTNMETCRDRLGIHKDLTDVGVPLGQLIFMPGAMSDLLAAALCMAMVYGTPISVPWVISLLLIAFIMSVSAPPLPGSAIACHILIMAQLGIPAEAIAVIIALSPMLDRLDTPINVSMLQLELTNVAGSLELLDEDVLHS